MPLSRLILASAVLGASLSFPVGADLAADVGIHALDDVGAAEAAFIRRGKIKKRASIGYKAVVVVGDDADADEVDHVTVEIASSLESPEPTETSITLPLKVVKDNGNKRFVFNQLEFNGDAVNFSYDLTVTMRDAAGEAVGEPETLSAEVEDDGDSRVRSVSIRQIDDTNFQLRVVVVGDDADETASVEVLTEAVSGPEAIPDVLEMTPTTAVGGKKVFKTTMTFSDPAAVSDEAYSLVIDLKNGEGFSLGSSEYEVVVEGLDEG